MEQHQAVYAVALDLLRTIGSWPHLRRLLSPLRGQKRSLNTLLQNLRAQADTYMRGLLASEDAARETNAAREAAKKAYEVLSDTVLREKYDEWIETEEEFDDFDEWAAEFEKWNC